MLSMSAMSAGQADYYLGLAREDYYLQGGEPPGKWFGEGAERLGLHGQVEANQLYNLFAGRTPVGDRLLIQLQRHEGKAEHRPGWDLTFSAPKSVSTLWSQCDQDKREVIEEIHARAVTAALDYLQDTSASTRRGKAGATLQKVGLVVATFEHSTSRALDPQLHTHALVMNVSIRDDGTSGSLSSLDLFLSKMAAGALYRAELARGLQDELNMSLYRVRSWFEVDGVSTELSQEFSKRREAIENVLKKTGLTTAEAAAVAAIQTRSAKEGASRSELFAGWQEIGRKLGWGPEQAELLLNMDSPSRVVEPILISVCCQTAAEKLTWNQAYFSERDFVRSLAEECQGLGFGATQVRQGAAEFLLNSPEIVALGNFRGLERYSTATMVKLEKELLVGADELASRGDWSLPPETTMRVLSKHGELSEEQMRALWHITAETGGIAIVSGMAGTGKTLMIEAAREAWEAEGFTVKGTSLSALAATGLQNGTDINSDTIAKLLSDLDRGFQMLDSKTVLVVDEAGMVATPDMRRLVAACQQAGSKLVLIGDERQLQPIGPGAPFPELGERFGEARLVDVRRQEEGWARKAVVDMADGKSRDALRAFAEHGHLFISDTRPEAMRDLISKWRTCGERFEDSLILAGTRNEARELNRLAQEARLENREIQDKSCQVPNGETLHVGDRVMFTKNKATLKIQNGSRGTILGMSDDGVRLSIHLDSGDKVTIQPHAFPHLELGYASTTHKAQGATTNKAFVLGGGPMQARELAYVQTSRAKLETQIFATKSESGDSIAILAREMERSHRKHMVATVERVRQRRSGIDPSFS